MSIIVGLIVLLVILIGCRGYNRLHSGELPEATPTTTRTANIVVSGTLANSNFVELTINPAKILYVEYMSFHATKYTEVLPFDESLKKKKQPYYVIDKNVILFFNVFSGSYRITAKP